jgi:hypothetical protein
VGNVDSKKSTTRFVYNLGCTTLCWVSKLQKIVVLSTTKAEYVAMTKARKEKV